MTSHYIAENNTFHQAKQDKFNVTEYSLHFSHSFGPLGDSIS